MAPGPAPVWHGLARDGTSGRKPCFTLPQSSQLHQLPAGKPSSVPPLQPRLTRPIASSSPTGLGAPQGQSLASVTLCPPSANPQDPQMLFGHCQPSRRPPYKTTAKAILRHVKALTPLKTA